jgi:hypothetical protein
MNNNNSRKMYTAEEAAAMLGVSLEQLRQLVKTHIIKDDDVPDDAIDGFSASDLLVLRILSGLPGPPTAA